MQNIFQFKVVLELIKLIKGKKIKCLRFIFVLASYKRIFKILFRQILVLGSIVSNQVNIKKEKSNKILYISEFYNKKIIYFPKCMKKKLLKSLQINS